MRGVMEFDDYNYAVHNPYILVEDPKIVEEEMKMKKDGDKSPRKIVSPTSAGSGPLGSDLVSKPAAAVQEGDEID